MFLVRVNLGRVLCHKDNTQIEATGSPDEREFDTVVAGFSKRFREFLVFNTKYMYPEFMIIYEREDFETVSN